LRRAARRPCRAPLPDARPVDAGRRALARPARSAGRSARRRSRRGARPPQLRVMRRPAPACPIPQLPDRRSAGRRMTTPGLGPRFLVNDDRERDRQAMQALMMDRPLTLPSILEYAAQYHPHRQVVDRMVEGPIHRYGYAQALARTKRMAHALVAMGVKPGDRVATLAWSTHRHFE